MEYGYQVPIGYIVFGVFACMHSFSCWGDSALVCDKTRLVLLHPLFRLCSCPWTCELWIQYRRWLLQCSQDDACHLLDDIVCSPMSPVVLVPVYSSGCPRIFSRRAICKLIYRKLVLGIELGDNRSEDGDDNSERERTIEELEHADKHIKRDWKRDAKWVWCYEGCLFLIHSLLILYILIFSFFVLIPRQKSKLWYLFSSYSNIHIHSQIFNTFLELLFTDVRLCTTKEGSTTNSFLLPVILSTHHSWHSFPFMFIVRMFFARTIQSYTT